MEERRFVDSVLTEKELINLEEMQSILNEMQAFNNNSEYSKTVEIYNKYQKNFPESVFLANAILNEYELATHKTVLKSKPRNVMVVLTNTCDLKCIMCYQERKDIKNISKKLVDIILDNLQYIERLIWQGGEVLTLPYFKYILSRTLEFPKIHYVVISNFQNISDETIELISQNNMALTLSVDGAFKETYEKIRVGSSFDRLEKNIGKLNECIAKYNGNINLRVNFVVMKINYKEIPDIVDFARKHKISIVGLLRCITEDENLKITKEDEKEVKYYIQKAQERADKYGIIITNTFAEFNDNDCQDGIGKQIAQVEEENKGLFCHLPWYEMLIQEDDTVKPHCACGYTSFKSLESYNNIDDIWNNEVMQNYRNHMVMNKYGSCIQKCKLMASYDTRKKFTK